MKPRWRETIFFERPGIVEVRSQPLWIKGLEFWFVWVHELTSHKLRLGVPKRIYDDKYWGEPLEAAFHHFFTWTLNYDVRIDRSETYIPKEGASDDDDQVAERERDAEGQ